MYFFFRECVYFVYNGLYLCVMFVVTLIYKFPIFNAKPIIYLCIPE